MIRYLFRPRSSAVLARFLLLLLAFPATLAAQSRSTSAIRGEVSLPGGAPAVGAEASLSDSTNGFTRTILVDSRGGFLFLAVPPGGPYTIDVRLIGFAPGRIRDLDLSVGEIRMVSLELAQTAIELEGITVQSDRADVFDRGRVGPATLLSAREIESLPLLSRNLSDLAALSPLVTRTESGGLSVAGQNERYNSILIDGQWAKDPFGLTPGGVPGGQAGAKLLPIDAVAQYEVLVAPYDVRLSGFTGGVMNAVTRRGGNSVEGAGSFAHRNPGLGGPLKLATGDVAEGSEVERSVFSFRLGGPIVRDRVHYFLAAEIESQRRPPQGFSLGREPAALIGLAEADARRAGEAIGDFIGEQPGELGVVDLDRTLTNVFARIDWRLSETSLLVARNIFASAQDEDGPNRLGFDPYGFSSNSVGRQGRTNAVSLELTSAIGARASNELALLFQTNSDQTTPRSAQPQVDVNVLSSVDGVAVSRDVRAGARLTAQDSRLSQYQLRLTDNVSLVKDRTTFTLGVSGALYGFDQRFLPGALGEFRFRSVAAVEAGTPDLFSWTSLQEGEPESVDFSVAELGILAQSELDAGKGLTLRFGVRMDVPYVLADPVRNWDVLNFFGWDTGRLPSGNALFSPRWSFNWQGDGERRTQVRGGAGLFSGQIPFVWLADALQQNGRRSVVNVCRGADAPTWTGQTPTSCRFGAPEEIRNVTVFSSDFRYPQDFRISLGFDREISDDASFSLGLLYNRALNQLVLSELNLGTPDAVGPVREFGGTDRTYHGRAIPSGFTPVRENADFGQVILASNESEDWAAAVTAEAQGRVGRVSLRAGYTWSTSKDRMSLVSTDMISNFGFTPVETHPNRQPLTSSNFERPHKVVISAVTKLFGANGPTVSLLYLGQSGAPFSYVYGGDLNGDGYPGFGPAFERTNDLFFVPDPSSQLQSGFATQALLTGAVADFDCLASQVGQILKRNSCRSPWQSSLDLRVAQEVQTGVGTLRLELDAVNVLNLLNSNWGRVETVRAVVPIVDFAGRAESLNEIRPLAVRWAGGSVRGAEGQLRPVEPWTPAPARSQWQIQLGARFSFGGG